MVVRTRSHPGRGNSGRGNSGRGYQRTTPWTGPPSPTPKDTMPRPTTISPTKPSPTVHSTTDTHSTSKSTIDTTSVPHDTWEESDIADTLMATQDEPSPDTDGNENSSPSKDNKKRPIIEITTDVLNDSRIVQHPKDVMYHRGEHMTEAITDKKTPVKIEFNLKSTVTKFNLRDELVQLYTKLRIADKNLILTSPDGTTDWTDEDDIPSGTTLTELLQARQDIHPNESTKITIHLTITSSQLINALKFHPTVYRHIFEKNIYVQHDRFSTSRTRSPGFLTLLPARLIWKQTLHQNLSTIIDSLELNPTEPVIKEYRTRNNLNTDSPQVPHFVLQKVTRKFGGINAEVLQVITKAADAPYMKRLLSILGENNMLPGGKFIPSGFHLMAGVDHMKTILREHNKYLSEITVVGIEGISQEAMRTMINTTTGPSTLREIIRTSVPNITSIELTTSTKDKGKWFIILQKKNERSLHQWIQGPLRNIFKAVPTEYCIPGFDGPQRVGSNNSTSIVGGYAAVLLNSISPAMHSTDKYDNIHPRPNKRQVINLLDEEDFPQLPHQSKLPSKAPHPIPTTITTHQPITQDTTNDNIPELLDNKVATLKVQLQQQITSQINELTTKLETQLNTHLATSINHLESRLTSAMDTKLNLFLQKLDAVLPSTPPPQTTPTHLPPDTSTLPDTQPPSSPSPHSQGTDPSLSLTNDIVGNEQSTDDDLI